MPVLVAIQRDLPFAVCSQTTVAFQSLVKETMPTCTASPGEVFPWCPWVGVILMRAAPGLRGWQNLHVDTQSVCALAPPACVRNQSC